MTININSWKIIVGLLSACAGLIIYIFKDRAKTSDNFVKILTKSLSEQMELKLSKVEDKINFITQSLKDLATQSDLNVLKERVDREIEIKFIKMQALSNKAIKSAKQQSIEARGMKQQSRAIVGKNVELLYIWLESNSKNKKVKEKVNKLIVENEKFLKNNK